MLEVDELSQKSDRISSQPYGHTRTCEGGQTQPGFHVTQWSHFKEMPAPYQFTKCFGAIVRAKLNGLAGEVLPQQTQGPEFDSQDSYKEEGVAACACNPSSEEAKTEGSLVFTGWPAQPSWRIPSQ